MGDGGIALGALGGETRKYGSTGDNETLVSKTLILSSDDVRHRIIIASLCHPNHHHDHHHSKITASDHDEEDKGRVTD